jgi:ketosteroid isomerase-like protein
VLDAIRAAADALNRGDPEPFVALVADDCEWRGIADVGSPEEEAPSCHGPREVREVLRLGLASRGGGEFVRDLELQSVGYDRVIGSADWPAPDGGRERRYQVLTVRDGKIIDIQGCSSAEEADEYARA